MKKNNKPFFLLIIFLYSCGNNNIFKTIHKKGGVKEPELLLNDAISALNEGDYSQAKKLYQEVLDKDPNNSEALLGYSQATLADAGLNLGSIVSNLLSGNTTQAILDPKTLDLNKLKIAAQDASRNLEKIIDGKADGKIPPNDVDANLNYATSVILWQAGELLDFDGDGNVTLDKDDPITITQDYKIKLFDNDPSQASTDIENWAKNTSTTTTANYLKKVYDATTYYLPKTVDAMTTAAVGVSGGQSNQVNDLKQDADTAKTEMNTSWTQIKNTIQNSRDVNPDLKNFVNTLK